MKFVILLGIYSGFLLSSPMALAQEEGHLGHWGKQNSDNYHEILQKLEPSAAIKLSQVNKQFNKISPGIAGAFLSVKLALQPTPEGKLKEAKRLAGAHGELAKLKNHVTHMADFQFISDPRFSPAYIAFMLELKKIFPHLKFIHHIIYDNHDKLISSGYFNEDPKFYEDFPFSWSQLMGDSGCHSNDPLQGEFKTIIAATDIIKSFKTGNDQDEELKKKIPYFVFYNQLAFILSNPEFEKEVETISNKNDSELDEREKSLKNSVIPFLMAVREEKGFEELERTYLEFKKRSK